MLILRQAQYRTEPRLSLVFYAFEAAEKNGKAGALQQEPEELFNRQNKAGSSDTLSIPATFLQVTVTV